MPASEVPRKTHISSVDDEPATTPPKPEPQPTHDKTTPEKPAAGTPPTAAEHHTTETQPGGNPTPSPTPRTKPPPAGAHSRQPRKHEEMTITAQHKTVRSRSHRSGPFVLSVEPRGLEPLTPCLQRISGACFSIL